MRTVGQGGQGQGSQGQGPVGKARGGRHHPRVAVAVAIALTALNLRCAITVVSPLLDPISSDVGLSAAQAGLLGSLAPLAFATTGLLTPLLLRRLAAEHVVVLALAISAVAQAARPAAGSARLFLVTSAVALLGLGVGNVVLPVLVKAWFPHRIAAFTATYITLLTLGTALPALVAVPVADAADARGLPGWQSALLLWAASAALAALPWTGAARRPRAAPERAGDGARPSVPLWRSRTAWAVTLVFGSCSLHVYVLLAWLPGLLAEAGLDDAGAGAALAVFAATGLPGTLLLPFVVARTQRHAGLAVVGCAGCFAVGDLGLLLSPTSFTMLWVALAGVGGGGFPISLTLVGLRTRSVGMAGVLSGFAQGLGYAMAAVGPLVVGLLRGASGTWTSSFALLLAVVLLMAAAGVMLRGGAVVEREIARSAARSVARRRGDTLGW